MSDPIVVVQSVTKRYPGAVRPALHHLSLTIDEGLIFGLLGPNGAGKTTLMGCLTGLVPYDSGHISLKGISVKQGSKSHSRLFGFVPQDFSFYQELSPIENLEFFGAWSGLAGKVIRQRSLELLEILGLSDVRHKAIHKFSGGMKRRVNLAIGVIHQPALLFLDEPTVGVDVQSRFAILSYLKELKRSGTTLIYTSHQLSEAEDICDRIALIDEGRIIANDTLANLLSSHGQPGLEELFLTLTGKAYRDSDV